MSTVPPTGAPSVAARSTARRVLVPLAKLLVSVLLMGILLSRIDTAGLWRMAKTAAPSWLATAVLIYFAMIVASAWRWGLLLKAQGILLPLRTLISSFLVATFFNNFLPSNIGGDVVRVSDTARAAGSKTLAATVVIIDRGIGLLGLVLVAAIGATLGRGLGDESGLGAAMLWAGFAGAALVAMPALLMPHWFGRLLRPVRALGVDWVNERLHRLTSALGRFRKAPGALGACFAGAVGVQAVLVGFYLAIANSMQIPVGVADLALIVPVSFVVQMIPISMNGFGVREATFGYYFTRLGLPLESALLVSFMGAALILLFSLTGAVAYLGRKTEFSYRSA